MKVYFIGAGPGDPELLTLKAHKIISKIDLCLYAGSLVPREILSVAPKKATLVDTSNLNLIEIQDYIIKAKEKDFNVARIHSGDVSVYGALSEQMNMLDQLNIEYEIINDHINYISFRFFNENSQELQLDNALMHFQIKKMYLSK